MPKVQPTAFLVRANTTVSLPGGLVYFRMNQELRDAHLIQLAQANNVSLIPLE